MSKRHKQVPQLLMRGFQHEMKTEDKAWSVYYLDLKTKQIKEEKINTLDSELNYYSDYVENHLKKIENIFGQISDNIRRVIKSGSNIEIEKYENDIKQFFKYCFLRSNQILK